MFVNIQGRKVEVTPSLKSYSLEKVSVLNKYLDGSIRVHMTMSVGKKFRQKVDVSVNGKGVHLKGSEETEDMYASIDKVMDKIARQAKKFKEKKKDHHASEKDLPVVSEEEEEATIQEIIRENADTDILMTDERAVEVLREGNKHFVVYKTSGGGSVHVAYYRSDGNIGITEY